MDYCMFLLTMYLFRQKNTSIPNQLNMELALFMDSAAYSILTEVLDHQELVDVTFSVINQVRPSLYYVSKKNGRMGGVGRWPYLLTFTAVLINHTDVWSWPSCIYTQIFSPNKIGFSPIKNTFQKCFGFCLPLFYATFQCGP